MKPVQTLTVRTALPGVQQRSVLSFLSKILDNIQSVYVPLPNHMFSGQIDSTGEVMPGTWEDCSPNCPQSQGKSINFRKDIK